MAIGNFKSYIRCMGTLVFPDPSPNIQADGFYYRRLFQGASREDIYFYQPPGKPQDGELPRKRLRQIAADADHVAAVALIAVNNLELTNEARSLFESVFEDCGLVHGFYLAMTAATLNPSRKEAFSSKRFLTACETHHITLLRKNISSLNRNLSAKAVVELSERTLLAEMQRWDSSYKAGGHPWDQDIGLWQS